MDNLRIAVILGGNRSGLTGPAVTRWFLDRARGHGGAELDVLDVADLGSAEGHGEPLHDFGARIEAADAFVVLTPEYNHAFPGPLKAAIDSARHEWAAKPVGFVSYGGLSGGLRAVEQLRLVFSELHTATLRDTVSFHNAQTLFAPDGTPKEDMSGTEAAVDTLLDLLLWWARALRSAREREPYPGRP
ncbi:NAD(P)H-dependent oxidoreductase [Nocardiopsis sp. NPDC049922]|uniref:NADPH-dependent FMN reductase n=1 Tax=Nocardiopsis sp. NPDC049922 TaxID=3155157 RepID=UPI0033F2B80F